MVRFNRAAFETFLIPRFRVVISCWIDPRRCGSATIRLFRLEKSQKKKQNPHTKKRPSVASAVYAGVSRSLYRCYNASFLNGKARWCLACCNFSSGLDGGIVLLFVDLTATFCTLCIKSSPFIFLGWGNRALSIILSCTTHRHPLLFVCDCPLTGPLVKGGCLGLVIAGYRTDCSVLSQYFLCS